jgi:hypothetical protein
MAFLNGAEPAAERRAGDEDDAGHSSLQPGLQAKSGGQSGPEDVTITIRGSMAARMLGRGDAEERILAELAGLKQRLDGTDAAAARQAAEHAALRQTVQELHDKLAQLSSQVAMQASELRSALASPRSDFDSHSLRATPLPGQLERVSGDVNLLRMQVNPLAGELAQLQMRLGELESRLPPPPPPERPEGEIGVHAEGGADQKGVLAGIRDRFEQWRQPDKPATNGEAAANGSWLKQRLNSLWLW